MSLIILYILLIIFNNIFNIWKDYEIVYFSVLLACISIVTLYQGVLIKSFSTLWFSITMILIAVSILVIDILGYVSFFIDTIVFLPIVSSFILLLLGRKIYFKVMILNLSIAIPILVIRYIDIVLWLDIVIFALSILIGLILSKSIKLGEEKV